MHKNRSEFLIYKYKYHYLCIYGKNPFEFFEDPSPKQIRGEAIKLLLSFSYNLKKFILNPELAPHKEKEFIRTSLISLEYIAAFYGYISIDKYDALRYLKENKLIKEKNIKFIQDVSHKEKLTFREKIKVIKFIDFYRELLVKDYLTFAQSDIRYVNEKIELHWNLKYPQAVSMAIVLHNHKILLVKRTHDDYIYPDMWTLPGGYLENKENFESCIKRELLEETNLTKYKIIPLFNGKKIKTKRVAIGCFLINSENNKIKLSEHSNFNFFGIKEINKLQLTPESKKVLNKYLNQ
jgi:ADP-ribose pyrophosphatase YjhB (NUDIX family)